MSNVNRASDDVQKLDRDQVHEFEVRDAWSQIVYSLLGPSREQTMELPAYHFFDISSTEKRIGSRCRKKSSRIAALECDHALDATISALEKLSDTSIILHWSSTRCHYGSQIWTRGLAWRDGLCALTRVPIREGDVVYRPRKRGRLPANAEAMIFALAIDGA